MYKRSYYEIIKQRLGASRQFLQVLMGPRQVGKTTVIRQVLEDYPYPWHYASADDATSMLWLSQQWETIRIKLTASEAKEALLVVDEIQKIADWSNQVKIHWDKDTFDKIPVKVILLGSSQLLIQKGLSESLAGRFEVLYLPHWSYKEMKDAFKFTMDDFIWFGGYPGSSSLIVDEQRWKDYIRNSLIETTLMRDILLLARIDKPILLRNLFELACSWSGQILSLNKMVGQLQDAGNTTTLANYLHLLKGAGLVAGLEKFTPNMIRQRSSSPKLQVFNTALMTALSPLTMDETRKQPEIWGRWFESAIGAHLLNHSLTDGFNLYYWREGNHEVDFILQKGKKIIALEVKSGKVRSTTGMEEFTKKYKTAKVILVGGDGISAEQFLMISPAILFDSLK
ncbi:MAG: ATP-binding protein [Bacteroidales bacterium]|nr:ATP-binding protein [Bacteroidales bacterium]